MTKTTGDASTGRRMRVAVVAGLPTHYRRPLWERLSTAFEADFFFTSRGRERYWSRDHQLEAGAIRVRPSRPGRVFVRALMRGRYDCIVCGLVGRLSLLEVWFAAKASRTPVVLWSGLWAHPETAFHRLSRPIVRYLYRSADAILVYGPHVAELVRAESGRTWQVYAAPNAIDNAAFRQPVSEAMVGELRRGLGLPAGRVAIYVGRLEAGKGLDGLLRACARTEVLAGLLIVGSGSLEEELRRLVDRLDLRQRVHFAGYVANRELAPYLDAADFLVLPSVTTPTAKEPWGLVANEAMNRARPVVASTAVGAAAGGLVVDRLTGLVVPEGDDAALAAAMDELARDDELRARLGRSASERVLDWSIERAVAVAEEAVAAAIAGTRQRD